MFQEGYAAVQDRLGSAYSTFRKSAEDQGLLFPLIAGRLACDVVAGATRFLRTHPVDRHIVQSCAMLSCSSGACSSDRGQACLQSE